jgi:hypothetical protein
VLVVVLAVVVLGLVAQQLDLFESSSSDAQSLSAGDARSAAAELRKAAVLPSFRRKACVPAPAI